MTTRVFVPEGTMLGRLRTYRQFGAEVRAEFADRPFIGGLKQDIQTGVRYEYNDFTNRNFFGQQGQILEDGDKDGTTVFDTDTDANAVSAFLQTTIHVAKDTTITPGLRLEHYKLSRIVRASTEEEGEAEEEEPCPGDPSQECAVIEGFNDDPFSRVVQQDPRAAGRVYGLHRLLPVDDLWRLSPGSHDACAARSDRSVPLS